MSFLGLRCTKLWRLGTSLCSTSSCSANSKLGSASDWTWNQPPSNPGNPPSPPPDRLDLELKDHEGSTALWLALQYITVSADAAVNPFEDDAPVVNGTSFSENSFAAQLIQRGSNADAPDAATGVYTHWDALLFFFLGF